MKKNKIFPILLFLTITLESFSQNCNLICNGDFENPSFTASPWMGTSALIPCWQTTASDSIMELWDSGFNGVNSFAGNQFMEIDAYEIANVYQDIIVTSGNTLNIGFAHRGRVGIDTMSVSIGLVGGVDTVLGYFADGDTSWGYYTVNYSLPTLGIYRISFNSVFAGGNDPGLGNFLDSVTVCSVTVGIDEIVSDNDFTVYPNPAQGTITINLKNKGKVLVYDLAGKIIFTKDVDKRFTTQTLNKISKGIYFVEVFSNSTYSIKKCIVE